MGERHRASTVTARWGLPGPTRSRDCSPERTSASSRACTSPAIRPSRRRSRTTSTPRSSRRSGAAASSRSSPTRSQAWDSVMRDGDTIVTTGTASGKSLCFNLPVLHVLAGDPARARALPLPHQGARAGPGAQPPGAPDPRAAARDLRRRHPAGGARRDQAPRERGPHQSGHAARRDPAAPRRVGRLPREPGAGDRRRGPRLPGRVRVPRRERAAAAAAARRRVRHPAAVRAHIGHDREPAVAGARADRPRLQPRRAGRLSSRAARGGDVQPAAAGRAHRPPRLRPRRGVVRVRRPDREGRAHDLLRPQPALGGADLPVRPQPPRGRRRPRRPGDPVPGRLHAAAAPRHRAAAWRAESCSAS